MSTASSSTRSSWGEGSVSSMRRAMRTSSSWSPRPSVPGSSSRSITGTPSRGRRRLLASPDPAEDGATSRGSNGMRVVSVNVSLPKRVPYQGRTVSTAIFKEPVAGRIHVRTTGLQGDAVGDPRVHGAPMKAVYAYPSEHYAFWSRELPGMALPWGMFGENVTTEGLVESDVHNGDQYRFGTAVLES